MEHTDRDDDEGLWNELSHQHSRELEQHRARQTTALSTATAPNATHAAATATTTTTTAYWQQASRVASRATQDVTAWSHSWYDAARHAYTQQAERGQYRHPTAAAAAAATTSDAYLDDFGIATNGDDNDDDDPFLTNYTSLDEHQHHPPQQRDGDNTFVLLSNFALRRPMDGWGAAADLDVFFSSLYNYYYHRGLVPLVGQGLVELATLFFTLTLSVFLFAYVDWHRLATCHDGATCAHQLGDYVVHHPFAHPSLWHMLLVLYCLIFLAYSGFAVWSFAHNVQDALRSKWVFEERLGISARKLEGGAVEWDRDVVAKLVELQQSGDYRVAIHGQEYDALVVANRIMRKENYLVALFNRGLLDLRIPYLTQQFYCASLEWSVYFCVLNFMFNHKYQIRPAFYLDPVSLRRRFVVCGIAHAIFMPFLLFFMTLHFGFQNAYDWKNTKQYLGQRQWSRPALWTFREFNELPHNFERRMAPSYAAAEGYLKLFGANEILAALGRVLVFVSGSLGAVLVVFAAINDAILLHVKLASWNLLWYAGVVGVSYSIGNAMIPSSDAAPRHSRNVFAEIETALQTVARHTHHCPETWKSRGWDQTTYKSFSSMFKFKAQLFVSELSSVMVAPYVLCVSLANCAESICDFVLAARSEMGGAGEVCGFATFDFDTFRDENWEGRTIGMNDPMAETLSESIMRFGNVDEAMRRFPKPMARQGKMEKSFFSFKAAHPNWKCNASGQQLVDQLESYRKDESAAYGREQQLHVQAALRQLQMLDRMEDYDAGCAGQQIAVADVSYIRRRDAAPADAGAGSVPAAFSRIQTGAHSSSAGFDSRNYASSHGNRTTSPAPEEEDGIPPFAMHHPASSGNGHSMQALGSRIRLNDAPSASATLSVRKMRLSPSFELPIADYSTSRATAQSLNPLGAPMPLGLSSELRRLLTLSTLETDLSSIIGSSLTGGGTMNSNDELTDDNQERLAERQYLWLERYHAHVAGQQQRDQSESARESSMNLMLPLAGDQASPGPASGGNNGLDGKAGEIS